MSSKKHGHSKSNYEHDRDERRARVANLCPECGASRGHRPGCPNDDAIRNVRDIELVEEAS